MRPALLLVLLVVGWCGEARAAEGDRVYTADQVSNTVSVIDPSHDRVLGTISLGQPRLDQLLGPLDRTQVNVHGLGFSPDGQTLAAVSITSNAAQLIRTQANALAGTSYVGRAPHEAMVTRDGRELWVAVRGESHVAILDARSGRVIDRVGVADGPSKVVFSPDGRFAYVNHLRARVLTVVRVHDRHVVREIRGVAPRSSDAMISPDGREVWTGHPFDGKATVVDVRRFRVRAVLDTGPRTNHVNFAGRFAYVTVGGLDQTLVFRRSTRGRPALVRRIMHRAHGPHGLWPNPDGTRMYVAMQKSDAVDVIDTRRGRVLSTLRIGQDPQALVYVPGAVRRGGGRAGLGRQGMGLRVMTSDVEVVGGGAGKVTVRQGAGMDLLDIAARGLRAAGSYVAYGVRPDGTGSALRSLRADGSGSVDQALVFTDFFGVYDKVVLVPRGARPPVARLKLAWAGVTRPGLCALR